MFDDIPLLTGIQSRMSFAATRQQVLSENAANVDTPDYKARDLDQDRFNRILNSGINPRINLAVTSGKHVQAQYGASSLFATKSDDFYEATVSGNTVNSEENLQKMNQNAADYSLATNLYQKMHGFISIAVTGR